MKALSFILLLLIPFLDSVLLLKLQGPCPDVPATSVIDIGDSIITKSIILGIPFTKARFSHLFKDINFGVSYRFKLQIYILNNDLTLRIDLGEPQSEYHLDGKGVLQNSSIYVFNTTIKLSDENITDCSNNIQEAIRMWGNEYLSIFYSCYEDGLDHDVAVLLMSSSVVNIDVQNQLRKIVGKYLAPGLLNQIDEKTDKKLIFKKDVFTNPYDCHADKSVFADWIIVLISVGVLAVVVLQLANFFN